jgi:hypothetical protein
MEAMTYRQLVIIDFLYALNRLKIDTRIAFAVLDAYAYDGSYIKWADNE